MFKKTLIFGIVLGFAGSSFAEGTETQGVQAIEPVFVLEYKFDEPVVDVIFDSATMTVKEARVLGVKGLEKRRAMEKVKVQYPKVVVVGKRIKYTEDYEELEPTSIKFFNEKRKIKKDISLSNITPKGWKSWVGFSKNKKYIDITSQFAVYSQDWFEKGPSKAKITMVDTSGQILWEIDISELGGPLGISPNGKYIVCAGDITGDYFGYNPSVWNSKGLVKELFERYLEVNEVDFSKDGSFFAVTVETGDVILDSGGRYAGVKKKAILVLFDEKGNELWRREVPDKIQSLNISDDDIITVITSKSRKYFDPVAQKFEFYVKDGIVLQEKFKYCFDKNGNLIESKEVK